MIIKVWFHNRKRRGFRKLIITDTGGLGAWIDGSNPAMIAGSDPPQITPGYRGHGTRETAQDYRR